MHDASKVYFNPGRLSKESIQWEINGSLRHLGTGYLDLYIDAKKERKWYESQRIL